MPEDSYGRLRAQLGRPNDGSDSMEVVSRLYRLVAHIDRMLVDLCKRQGLTHWEAGVLVVLARADEPSFSPSQLAAAAMCSTGAMTNRLDRLEARGLIKRMPDPHDGRGTIVAITEDGLARIRAATADRIKLDAEIVPGLSVDERRMLAFLLRDVLATFESRTDKPLRHYWPVRHFG